MTVMTRSKTHNVTHCPGLSIVLPSRKFRTKKTSRKIQPPPLLSTTPNKSPPSPLPLVSVVPCLTQDLSPHPRNQSKSLNDSSSELFTPVDTGPSQVPPATQNNSRLHAIGQRDSALHVRQDSVHDITDQSHTADRPFSEPAQEASATKDSKNIDLQQFHARRKIFDFQEQYEVETEDVVVAQSFQMNHNKDQINALSPTVKISTDNRDRDALQKRLDEALAALDAEKKARQNERLEYSQKKDRLHSATAILSDAITNITNSAPESLGIQIGTKVTTMNDYIERFETTVNSNTAQLQNETESTSARIDNVLTKIHQRDELVETADTEVPSYSIESLQSQLQSFETKFHDITKFAAHLNDLRSRLVTTDSVLQDLQITSKRLCEADVAVTPTAGSTIDNMAKELTNIKSQVNRIIVQTSTLRLLVQLATMNPVVATAEVAFETPEPSVDPDPREGFMPALAEHDISTN